MLHYRGCVWHAVFWATMYVLERSMEGRTQRRLVMLSSTRLSTKHIALDPQHLPQKSSGVGSATSRRLPRPILAGAGTIQSLDKALPT